MLDTFFIRDLETMKALSDPRRVEILGLLQKPRTTRQVADVLGETANAMHYHILALEKHHLIGVVKTAMKGHMQEKYYQAAARFYSPAASLLESRFDPYKNEVLQAIQVMQETALDELHRASADTEMEEKLIRESSMIQKQLRLSPSDMAEFQRRMDELVLEYAGEQTGGSDSALLTVYLFPTSRLKESENG